MGKTAMPIICFFTKISSVVSERLNTPALITVVNLQFHSNKFKFRLIFFLLFSVTFAKLSEVKNYAKTYNY